MSLNYKRASVIKLNFSSLMKKEAIIRTAVFAKQKSAALLVRNLHNWQQAIKTVLSTQKNWYDSMQPTNIISKWAFRFI